ncbi:Phage head-tail joining protein [Devosia lucknowensis]|uniref:Phage head-tail joining protein n=1 Tax=Devosia lucknowensis TaxID=1096929 RepID=A0A1Y6ET14_9HYPH|nr:head-tail adaptor protein [Devosia lucknowensis]SMQ65878.1 Phage head-tail joining protein [Devosia lucknowensis]
MAKPPTSGALRGRVHFQRRQTEPDPWGGDPREGDWATVTTCAAEFLPLKGSETVIANRLQGIQPYIVRVRQSAATWQVDETWRVVDARDDARVFAIKAPPTDPDQKRQWLEFLVEQGRTE